MMLSPNFRKCVRIASFVSDELVSYARVVKRQPNSRTELGMFVKIPLCIGPFNLEFLHGETKLLLSQAFRAEGEGTYLYALSGRFENKPSEWKENFFYLRRKKNGDVKQTFRISMNSHEFFKMGHIL